MCKVNQVTSQPRTIRCGVFLKHVEAVFHLKPMALCTVVFFCVQEKENMVHSMRCGYSDE